LYSSPDIIREKDNKICRQAERTVEIRNAHIILLRKHKGKRGLGKQRRRLEDNIKMNLKKQRFRMYTGFIWLRIGSIGELL
jgi:hypothetical protein